jgi:SSS family transporter
MRISPLDLGILLVYLAGVTLLGAWFRRGQKDIRDYFLGGRTAPAWAIACSIVATETSTLTIIGTPGIAYGGNLGFLQLVLGYVVARGVLCLTLVPRYFHGEFYTAYQLLEKRFGGRVKPVAAGVFLVTRALAEGVRIAAVGKVVSVAFGTGDRAAVAIVTALTLFYTFEGGMKAVIWTDVLQFSIYLIGSVAAFFLLLHKIPDGWMGVTQAAAAAGGKLRIFDFTFSPTRAYTFWAGVIGGTFLTMASHGTDQTMVQRLLAARSERDAKTALLASGAIVFAQFTLFLVLGVMLFVFYQHALLGTVPVDADRIFPQFIVTEMPIGFRGLVLAAILAVAMSNASGALNSLSSSSIMDFRRTDMAPKQPSQKVGDAASRVAPSAVKASAVKASDVKASDAETTSFVGRAFRHDIGRASSGVSTPEVPFAPSSGTDDGASQRALLRKSRRMTLGWGAVLGILGLVHWGPVLVAGLTIASVTYGAMLGTFLLGIWNRRANATGAIIGMVTGVIVMVAVRLFTPLAWTWYVLAGTIVTYLTGSIASAIAGGNKLPEAPATTLSPAHGSTE